MESNHAREEGIISLVIRDLEQFSWESRNGSRVLCAEMQKGVRK